MKKERASNKQMQPYWDLTHGFDRYYNDLPVYAQGLVDKVVFSGKASRQYDIYGDSLISFTKAKKEKKKAKAHHLEMEAILWERGLRGNE